MKPCPHFLKRFAVLAAASLILSAVTLSASAAAAPVKYEEKRSTVTTVDGAQKKEDLAVTVEYQVGSTSIRAYTVEKDEVIGVSKDMWSLYGAFTSDWITDGTYTLSQPLNSVEQITVSVPYGDTARTNESYFVFHVPEGTVVTTPSWSYDMDLYKGKTIADVKAVVEAGQDPNTLIDTEDDYDPFETDVEYTDTSAFITSPCITRHNIPPKTNKNVKKIALRTAEFRICSVSRLSFLLNAKIINKHPAIINNFVHSL